MDNWIIDSVIDLQAPPVETNSRPILLMLPGDKKAHVWRITVYNGNSPANFTGASVTGYFLRRDRVLVTCPGTIAGNVITVELTAGCYSVSGGLRGAVRVTTTGKTVTLADKAFVVQPTIESENVLSETYIPTLPELLNMVARLEVANANAIVLAAINGITSAHVENETLVISKTPINESGAYAAAVAAGYTGTETEWNNFAAVVANNTSVIATASNKADAAVAAVAALVSKATVTVEASAWQNATAPYTATVSCSAATASNTLLVSVSPPDSAAGYDALSEYGILCTGQAAGQITLTAFRYKPASALTVNVLGVNV